MKACLYVFQQVKANNDQLNVLTETPDDVSSVDSFTPFCTTCIIIHCHVKS